jgi:hypothetical protein
LALPLRATGLPEPDLVLYGIIRDVAGGNVRLTAGTLTWEFQPANQGNPLTVTATVTNINDQFSYVLRVPCETPLAGSTASPTSLILGSSYDRSEVTVDNHAATFVQAGQQTLALADTDRGRVERIDLQVSIGGGGLLPDNWQLQYFGRTGIDPFADADGDGMDNLGEFRSGTHPADGSSVFEIEVVDDADGGPRLTWSSVAGHVYTVQRSGTLLSGFQAIAADLPATPPRNVYQDTTAGSGPLFYRIVVNPAP